MIHIAKTENGLVRGITSGDTHIIAFKGVPFAAPPVGKNRWRVPQPAENWEGIKECLEFGPAGMQDVYTGTGFYDKEWNNDPQMPMSEDCLQLNIWTPAKTPEERLPVMIWIFGGGLQGGHPAEMEFDGERIARRGIVFVSINYRTNVFGFFAHPEITAECGGTYCTNFGLFDQKAGIDWVERNIANFGGDPNNVTIFGQSAGGRSVLCQVISPLNENSCIKRVISQSSSGMNFALGGHGTDYLTLKEAEEAGKRFFQDFLGVSTLEEARALDAAFVRDKGREYRESGTGSWQFVVDDCFLPDQPVNMMANNQRLQIPLMTGSTTNEFFDVITANSLEEFETKARALYGEYSDEFLELCEFARGDLSRVISLSKVNGSPFGARLLAMRAVDAGLPVWFYEFDPDIPGDDNPGAFHSSDLWFVFETLGKCWRPFKGKHYDLARLVCNYWTNFAKTGDPNGLDADGTPMPTWEPFTSDFSPPMVFDDTAHMGEKELSPSVKGMYKLAADKLWRKK
jgi:para-nitrobenzyl esterase